ncbi:serine/arginine repetitive matrix protein 1-like [Bubalus kerabau]|uniref:serine/arginine repetitive matrix protein 1-like n=1 Tax=Bubalus carabanensis TaxID=3119969 RepID=UPI00244EA279|nr:serine/arginine repetitive matrix protein 1-like [Bubalus carabanensis]
MPVLNSTTNTGLTDCGRHSPPTPGAAATWRPEPAPCRWSLGRRPGPRPAENRVSPTAAPRPPARRRSRCPGEGVLFWIQRTRTAATAAARARAAPAARSPPSSHPWLTGIFPRRGGKRPRRRRRGWCRWTNTMTHLYALPAKP